MVCKSMLLNLGLAKTWVSIVVYEKILKTFLKRSV